MDSEFNPDIHEKTLHTKGPLKGKETWIRKSAARKDARVQDEADRRNIDREDMGWLKRLFTKKTTGLDVLTEEALKNHLKKWVFGRLDSRPEAEAEEEEYVFSGEYDGHKISLLFKDISWGPPAAGRYNIRGADFIGGQVDGQKISSRQSKELFKRFFPLFDKIKQNEQNLRDLNTRIAVKQARRDEKMRIKKEDEEIEQIAEPLVNEILGKTTSALPAGEPQKRFPPYKGGN